MNKQELLQWLADHLETWPVNIKHGPNIPDWDWVTNNLANRIELCYNVKYAKPATILMEDWHIAVMSEIAEVKIEPPKPGKVEAMIDIETFDVTHNALVFQASVTFFDVDHTIVYRELWNLDFDEQFQAGRSISASTTAFHLGIPSNALEALKDKNIVSMAEFAKHLTKNLEIYKPRQVWAKGSFDFNILENMFNSILMPAPWKFYQLRELRTLMQECGVPKGEVAHNALADCEAQVKQLAACRAVIDMGKKAQEAGMKFAEALNAKAPDKMCGLLIEPIERHPSNQPDIMLAKEAVLSDPSFTSASRNQDNGTAISDDEVSGD